MIICSAIRILVDGDPMIIGGLRHADCLEKIWKLQIVRNKAQDIQGFLTDRNEFLGRREAKFHARNCHQILPGCDSDDVNLYSEDIWPE